MGTPSVAVIIGREPAARYSVHRGYVDAVFAAGGLPVLVPAGPDGEPDRILDLVAACDALLLTGGSDVDPVLYGAERGGGEKDPDPERDALEIDMAHQAQAAGKKVLGICRGIQLMAAAFGGRLIPDLPSAGYVLHEQEDRQTQPVHGITATPGSQAERVLSGAQQVNSIHHQAVADPGPSLRATAWSEDGVIEAIEAPGLLGIQWHPERMFTIDRLHLAPFTWLVEP